MKYLSKNIEWLIAGLGNPGKRYANNRHNIGWMVAAALAEKYKKPIMSLSSIYMQAALRIDEKLILAILPTTYMNLSGEAVAKVCKEYDIAGDRLIVVCDEYNFPLGRVHIKSGGGDGGHNGIASIIDELQANNFWRLRCGIGKNFEEGGMVQYVLSDFLKDEIAERDVMINKTVESIEAIVRLNPARAMSLINSGRLWAADEADDNTNEKENNDD